MCCYNGARTRSPLASQILYMPRIVTSVIIRSWGWYCYRYFFLRVNFYNCRLLLCGVFAVGLLQHTYGLQQVLLALGGVAGHTHLHSLVSPLL